MKFRKNMSYDKNLWRAAGVAFIGLLCLKQLVWNIVQSDVSLYYLFTQRVALFVSLQLQRKREIEDEIATTNYRNAVENGKRFKLPPMTEQERKNVVARLNSKEYDDVRKL